MTKKFQPQGPTGNPELLHEVGFHAFRPFLRKSQVVWGGTPSVRVTDYEPPPPAQRLGCERAPDFIKATLGLSREPR